MKKKELIQQILLLDPANAYNCDGEYVGNPKYVRFGGDWTKPYRKYVRNKSKYLGDTGGPSRAEIWDYKYEWNKSELHLATEDQLADLLEKVKRSSGMWKAMLDKFGKEMSLFDFLTALGK